LDAGCSAAASQGADGSWWHVAGIRDKCVYAVLGTDALYLFSRRGAPHGKVLRLPLTAGATVADAHEIVPASDLVIEDLAVTRETVWTGAADRSFSAIRSSAKRPARSTWFRCAAELAEPHLLTKARRVSAPGVPESSAVVTPGH
jgi:hypothetical protein